MVTETYCNLMVSSQRSVCTLVIHQLYVYTTYLLGFHSHMCTSILLPRTGLSVLEIYYQLKTQAQYAVNDKSSTSNLAYRKACQITVCFLYVCKSCICEINGIKKCAGVDRLGGVKVTHASDANL